MMKTVVIEDVFMKKKNWLLMRDQLNCSIPFQVAKPPLELFIDVVNVLVAWPLRPFFQRRLSFCRSVARSSLSVDHL